MAKKTINVLAVDFENNYHMNLDGCPVILALERAGLNADEVYIIQAVADADYKAMEMFKGDIPIEDFSFEIEI